LLLALVCAVYAPYLANAYIFDDLNLFDGVLIYDYAAQLWKTQVRWLSYATLAHTYILGDGSIIVLRLGNLLLHAANAMAVFVLLRDLLTAADERGDGAGGDAAQAGKIAFLGAALFAVHPVAIYGVGYLVQRAGEMSTLFMLLMLIAYLRWLRRGNNSAWIWSAVWYLLSVFSKEHSIAAPAVALSLTLVLHKPSLALARRLAPPFAAYAAIAVAITLVAKGVLGEPYEKYAIEMLAQAQGITVGQAAQHAYSLSLITQTALFFTYLFLWVVPNPAWMSMDMREPLATSLLSWPYWAAAIVFLCYPIVTIGLAMRGGRLGVAGWALAFPWLMFATELATARVQEPFVLYRAYLWFPVTGVLLPLAISTFNRRAAALAVAVVVCVFVPLSWNRLASLAAPLAAWNDAAKLLRGDEPGAARIFYNRSLALAQAGRVDEAMTDIDRAVALEPRVSHVRMARARLLYRMKRYDEALDEINAALNLDPGKGEYLLGRAIALHQLGRVEDGDADFRAACDLKVLVACIALQQAGKK
jgi:tetratricopeptide (TPR) repeat protein